MGETIRELLKRNVEAQRDWRPNWREALKVFEQRAAELVAGLPVRACVIGSTQRRVASHIYLLESLEAGRLKRRQTDLLCGGKRPETHFQATLDPATCLKCLELAERLAEKE